MTKIAKKLPVIIFMLLHFSFLTAALVENRHHSIATLFLVVMFILLGSFYRSRLNLSTADLKISEVLLSFAAATGAMATYCLQIELGLGAVLAAGITGLISSFIPFIKPESDILGEIPVAIYCGAFAGMTTPMIAGGYLFIILAGLASGLLLVLSKNTLAGHGGKLGTIAFGGVTIMSIAIFLIS